MREPRWSELPDPPSEGLVILHLARLVERKWPLDPLNCDACLYAWLLMNEADAPSERPGAQGEALARKESDG